jgi:hypothetical protein
MIALMKQKVKYFLRLFLVKVMGMSKCIVAPVGLENYQDRKTIHSPIRFKRKVPKFSFPLHYKFYPNAKGIQAESERTFIQQLNNVRVFSRNGFVISKSNKLVSETNSEDERCNYLLDNFFFRKVKKVNHLSLLVTAKDASLNYFHWMTDALPKISIAEKAGFTLNQIDVFIVSNDSLRFQQETLAHLGIKKEKRLSLSGQSLIFCNELIMPSATCLSGNVSPWIIDYLRMVFKDWMQPDPTLPSNIFIGRKKGGKRVLLNENQIVKAVEEKNFKMIYLEEFSVCEQVKLFYNAKQIVGVHGAGLTNLLFSQPGCFVVELFPVNYVNQCYWTIASYNDLEYTYILGEGKDIADTTNHLIDEDFVVSVEKLLQLFENNLA